MPLFLPFLLLCLLALPCPGLADTVDELQFKAPKGFTELSDHSSDLFVDTERQAISHGRLLRMYLPNYMAHQYKYGSRDAVTQQVLICAMKDQKRPLEQKDIELLARSTEGLFIGFSRVPRSRMDTPEQALEKREEALEQALIQGTPMLVESLRTPHAYLYIFLIHYNMAERGPKAFLSTAMATAVVPVRDTAVFVTVSSIIGRDSVERHLEWVKESATAFSEMIQSVNKQDKKS